MLTSLLLIGLLQDPLPEKPSPPKTGAEWNQAGVSALEKGQLRYSLQCFEEAKALLPKDETVSVNLSRALGQLALVDYRENRLPEALIGFQAATQAHRDNGTPELLAARCLLRLGRREEALEQALLLHQDFPKKEQPPLLAADIYALRMQLDLGVQLLKKIEEPTKKILDRMKQLQEEQLAWKSYLRDYSLHFEVLYNPNQQAIVGAIPLIIQDLENACTDVSSHFGLLPTENLVVLVLDKDRYKEQAPEWSAGLYDGRIRLSVGDYQKEKKNLRTTIRHEYAHAVLHNLGAQLPSWFQEGIAQSVENRSLEVATRRTRQSLEAGIRLANLQGDWTSWEGASRVRAAYSYSLCFVQWIETKFGAHAWPLLFDAIRQRGLEKATESVLGYSVDELDEQFSASFSQ
ncbi:MAG: hypothetical protein QGH51_03620 [Planctomycetota bacterium]|jgi:tetratricopeptide (TPR) repeat protein|nr:hypothetical protein [Planctomycetota bacterium]MDP6941096.1 hypothetical protein [Planctomycetota bacterium]